MRKQALSPTQTIAYSIVVPVFRACETLRQLHSELVASLGPLERPFEIILVDDCSADASWDVISELAAADGRVRGLQLMRNSGQGAATMAGLARARGDLVVTMDDDLQNPPREVPRLLRFMEEHPEIDIVFGRPREKRHAGWRRTGSMLVNALSNRMFEQRAGFRLTSFRVIRRDIVLPLLQLQVSSPAIGALLTTLTRRLANVDVDHAPRSMGRSGYSARKLFGTTLRKFLGFSTFPLRFLAGMGLIGIALSIFLGFFVLSRYLIGDVSVPGWTTLSLLLIGLSGFMFLAFGIIGEYLQQILLSVRQSPVFVVRSELGSPHQPAASPVTEIARTTATKV